jgi:hypothetical protein
MSKAKLIGLGVAVATLAAAPAFAQVSPSPPTATRPSTTGEAAPSRPSLPSDIKMAKASDLVGKNVYSAADEKIGDIDAIVTSKTSKEPMAVIGVGGFLGIGEKKAAVPIDQLKVQGDKIVASGLTKDSLKAQAEYKSDEYDKVDRERVVGELTGGAGGSSTMPPSGSTSSPSGTGGSSSGSTGMGGTTGSGSSAPAGNAPATGSGSSSSGSSTDAPKPQ